MNDQAAVAVESLPTPKRLERAQPKTQPPYAVVVFNDDIHTFEYVVGTFMKVFGYAEEKSFTLALQIHNEGRGIVWSGTRELAELKRDKIRGAGHDFNGVRAVESPLSDMATQVCHTPFPQSEYLWCSSSPGFSKYQE
jgi:ATP-dependent Clp protease adaptor protein ClpS